MLLITPIVARLMIAIHYRAAQLSNLIPLYARYSLPAAAARPLKFADNPLPAQSTLDLCLQLNY